jgi:peptide deformylase
MAIRPIRLFGDPILLTEAEPVTDFDRPLRTLVKDLTETLRDAGGAGLTRNVTGG